MITFTIDVEDPTALYEAEGRYITMTRHILDLCDRHQRRATFFVVGRIAEAAPLLIRDIAAKGHEIAYHSHAHVPLTREQPQRFSKETAQDKDHLEQLLGHKVLGFRAPQFSLTPDSLWALDILGELGFTYSSSIMPTRLSRHGYPGIHSSRPFTWPNGIYELPLPITSTLGFPYLGGIYLYALPFFLTRKWANKADPSEILWTYTHPYDFDRSYKFKKMAETPLWVSTVLGLARFVADQKIERLLHMAKAPPLAERLEALQNIRLKHATSIESPIIRQLK